MITGEADTRVVDQKLRSSRQDFRQGCLDGLRKSGQIVRNRIRWLIKNPPKTGIKYPNLPNRSSASGEAPAYQSGNLYNSAKYKAYRWDLMEVGVTAFYGGFLEYGTKKMRPRPHVSTAVSQTFQAVKIALSMSIDRRLSK